jgi:hypothetical protein
MCSLERRALMLCVAIAFYQQIFVIAYITCNYFMSVSRTINEYQFQSMKNGKWKICVLAAGIV